MIVRSGHRSLAGRVAAAQYGLYTPSLAALLPHCGGLPINFTWPHHHDFVASGSTLVILRVPGSPDFIVAAGMLAVMVGVFQLKALGLFRLGFITVNFVSHSVIVGFDRGRRSSRCARSILYWA